MQEKLNKLLERAYSPYSGVKVSSIVKTIKGDFCGVNVENAGYGSTICAERNAILTAVTEGVSKGGFKEIHLTASTNEPLWPCGACRQVMSEFFEDDTKVVVWNKGEAHEITFGELMPNKVEKESLK